MRPVPFQPAHPATLHRDLLETALSLDEIAHKHNTSFDDLSRWITSDDGINFLTPAADALSLRVRLTAASHIPQALDLIKHIVDSYAIDTGAQPPKPDPMPDTAAPLKGHLNGQPQPKPLTTPQLSPEETHRARESARRAAALLLRLTRFSLTLTPPSRSKTNDPLRHRDRLCDLGDPVIDPYHPAAVPLGASTPTDHSDSSSPTPDEPRNPCHRAAVPPPFGAPSPTNPFNSSSPTAPAPPELSAASVAALTSTLAAAVAAETAAYHTELEAAAAQARLVLARFDQQPAEPTPPIPSRNPTHANASRNELTHSRPPRRSTHQPASNSPASLLALSDQPRAP